MVRRSTWILVVVFAVLAVGTFILQRSGKLEPTTETTPFPTAAPIFGLNTGQITDVRIEKGQSQFITFSRSKDNTWQISEPMGLTRDLTQAQTTFSGITSGWTVQNPLNNPPPVEQIGLDKPTYILTFTFDNGQKRVMKVGNLTPTSSGYYVQMEGGAPLVVSKTSIDQVLNMLDLLLEPTVTPTSQPSVGSGTPNP